MGKLHKAASKGLDGIVAKLIISGNDVNERDENGAPALLLACYYGWLTTANFLLDHGADVNAANNRNYSSLMVAARQGWVDIVKLLVERCANVDAQCEDGLNALMYSIVYSPNQETSMFLIANGADVLARRSKGITALMYAASCGRLDVVKALVQRGAEVQAMDEQGRSAIDKSKERNFPEIEIYLISQDHHNNS